MSIQRRCCVCGRILRSTDPWYICNLEVFAGADDLVLPPEELLQDHPEELARLAELLNRSPIEDVEADVYRFYRWIFCTSCESRLRKPGNRD